MGLYNEGLLRQAHPEIAALAQTIALRLANSLGRDAIVKALPEDLGKPLKRILIGIRGANGQLEPDKTGTVMAVLAAKGNGIGYDEKTGTLGFDVKNEKKSDLLIKASDIKKLKIQRGEIEPKEVEPKDIRIKPNVLSMKKLEEL